MVFDNPMVLAAVFIAVSSFVLLVAALVGGRRDPAEGRLAGATGTAERPSAQAAAARRAGAPLPRIGAALMPDDNAKVDQLNTQLRRAGLYQRHSAAFYLGGKFVLMVLPMGVSLGLWGAGLLTMTQAVVAGAGVGLFGYIAPMAWLRKRKLQRQTQIRRALPDALDVIVVCMEGGLSLPASFGRVAAELREAHPLLAREMAIVRREIQLGRTTGEALREFADRFDAEELRSLASVVIQAERYGASIVKALRVHADTLRMKRYQYAETQAQKAPVKLIFPTVLCIFPALYIVLMGPAGVQLWEMLEKLGR